MLSHSKRKTWCGYVQLADTHTQIKITMIENESEFSLPLNVKRVGSDVKRFNTHARAHSKTVMIESNCDDNENAIDRERWKTALSFIVISIGNREKKTNFNMRDYYPIYNSLYICFILIDHVKCNVMLIISNTPNCSQMSRLLTLSKSFTQLRSSSVPTKSSIYV